MSRKQTKKAEIISKIQDFVGRYLVMGEAESLIYAHYVVHTHQFSERVPNPYTSPILYVHSAQKGSGKSLLGVDITRMLCRNAEAVVNPTAATTFRLAASRCTLAIDEVDRVFAGGRGDDALVSAINAGYRKGGYVPRYDKNSENEIRRFDVFCPKVLVGIDNSKMPDTTRDRCIPIHMHRATEEERKNIQPLYSYRVEDEVTALVEEIWQWVFENTQETRDYDPEPMPSLSPREWEISMPLVQLAKFTGYEAEIRDAIARVYEEQNIAENSVEIEMLLTIQELFEQEQSDRIPATLVLQKLAEADERMKGWSGKKLAVTLAPFGVKNQAIRFPVGGVQRGYYLRDFVDAFKRYLGNQESN